MKLTTHHITGDTPSACFSVPVYEFGITTGGPKIYLQAGMHADEHPGMLILHHLMALLETAEAENKLQAHFVILPVVNPLGLADLSYHRHQGRYHPENALNYNRGWPDFAKIVMADDEFVGALGDDADQNKILVRKAIERWLDKNLPISALDQQRHIVMRHCFDAEMVLDLHCDDIALNHIFIVPQNLPRYQSLVDWMGSQATLTAEDSGGGSFDEVWSALWIKLAKSLPDVAWPEPVLSATLEYRGQQDVADKLNYNDAKGLYHFFCDENMIDDKADISRPSMPAPTAFTACEIVRVTQTGLLAYQVSLGDIVKAGDVIAELISLDGAAPARERTPIVAGTDGLVFSLNQMKYVWPGMSIAKIAGNKPVFGREGYLLED